MKKTIFGIMALVAFLFVIGTVGALDNNLIAPGACLLRGAFGLAVFGGCSKAAGLWC